MSSDSSDGEQKIYFDLPYFLIEQDKKQRFVQCVSLNGGLICVGKNSIKKGRQKMQTKNYQLTIEETMEKYGLKDRTGLTKKEAAQRLSEVGLNQLTTKKTPKWKLLLRQFNNMIIYILIFSALLTLLMGHL